MSAPAATVPAAGPVRLSLRWTVPAALLAAEYAILSVLVDFPTSGPALRLASAARMLVPAGVGAVAAGWLISRRGMRGALRDMAGPLPSWRPWPLLLAQLVAFAATAWIARRALGPAAPPATVGALLAVAGGAAICALLALATAAPVDWLARVLRIHLGAETAALALGLLAWRAVALAEGLWGVLGDTTLHAVAALLRITRADAVVVPEQAIVGLPEFEVRIAPVCSGVDGLGLVLVFQALWLSLARGRLRLGRALLLLPLGAAAALVANAVRIAALVTIGASGREDLAMGAFHSKLGWLLFLGIAAATVLVAEHLAWFRRADAEPDEGEGVPRRAAAYVGPLVAVIAASLLTSLWTSAAFDPWYGARAAAGALVLLAVRRELPRAAMSFSWAAVLLGAAVGLAWIAWPRGDGAPLAAAVGQLPAAARTSWIAARLVGACLVLPAVEELAFRGFLLPWIVSPRFDCVPARAWTWPAVIVSSIAFGAVHDHLALGAAAGAAFALARLWRGRLADAVLAHAVANGAVAIAVLGLGRWDLWS